MDNHGPPAPVPGPIRGPSGQRPPSGPPRSPEGPPAATPAPPEPGLPGPPLSVGGALDWAFRTFARRFAVLVGLTALLVAPVTIATSLFADVPVAGNVVGTAQSFLPLLVDDGPLWLLALKIVGQLFLWPVFLVALNRETVGTYLGEPPTLGAVLRQGVLRWRSMLWISVLVAVVYLAAGAIVLAVTLLLREVAGSDAARVGGAVLGGPLLVFFATRLAFPEVLLIAEGNRGRAAIGRSWLLTEGRTWRVLGGVLVAAFLAIVVNLAIGTLAGLLTDASPARPDLVLSVAVAIGQLFTTPFFALVVTALLFACLAEDRPFDANKQLRYVHALDR